MCEGAAAHELCNGKKQKAIFETVEIFLTKGHRLGRGKLKSGVVVEIKRADIRIKVRELLSGEITKNDKNKFTVATENSSTCV